MANITRCKSSKHIQKKLLEIFAGIDSSFSEEISLEIQLDIDSFMQNLNSNSTSVHLL